MRSMAKAKMPKVTGMTRTDRGSKLCVAMAQPSSKTHQSREK